MIEFKNIITATSPNTPPKHIRYAMDIINFLYNNPKRSYHNYDHVKDCLECLYKTDIPEINDQKNIIALSLIYHDCIYDPKGIENEKLSAELAFTQLTGLGFYRSYAEKVYDLIMLTRHTKTCNYLSGQVIMDIDMTILGSSPLQFKRYDEKIKEEYSFVPEAVYREKRIHFLEKLKNKESIFQTGYFKDLYEKNAQSNIRTLIKQLKDS